MQTVKTSQIVYRLLFQRPISFTSVYFLQPLITQKLFSSPMSLATWSIHSDLKPKSKISLLSYPSSLVYKQRPPLNSSISSYRLGARSLSKRRLFAPQIVYAFCCENCSPLLVDQNAMLCLCWLKVGYLIRLVGVWGREGSSGWVDFRDGRGRWLVLGFLFFGAICLNFCGQTGNQHISVVLQHFITHIYRAFVQ